MAFFSRRLVFGGPIRYAWKAYKQETVSRVRIQAISLCTSEGSFSNASAPHIDVPRLPPGVDQVQPANYRILVEGSFDQSLFVCKNSEGEALRYAELPGATDVFALHERDYHGAVHRNPKCILFLAGEVDQA